MLKGVCFKCGVDHGVFPCNSEPIDPDIEPITSTEKKEDVVEVTKNTGEVAYFDDGTMLLRQRPTGLLGITRIMQMDTFRYIFAVGTTLAESRQLLKDPDAPQGGDGRGVGRGLK